MEMVLLGDNSFTLGFKLAGIKRIETCYSEDDYAYYLKELLGDPNVGIIVLPQEALDLIPLSLRSQAEKSINPIVFPIGDQRSVDIKNQIIKLIGVDLWK